MMATQANGGKVEAAIGSAEVLGLLGDGAGVVVGVTCVKLGDGCEDAVERGGALTAKDEVS